MDVATGAQIAQLISPTSSPLNSLFGLSVGISGGTAIVGSYGDYENGLDSGAAFLFDAATGALIAQLSPDSLAAGDEFGVSVAISGNVAIVGSPSDDERTIAVQCIHVVCCHGGVDVAAQDERRLK